MALTKSHHLQIKLAHWRLMVSPLWSQPRPASPRGYIRYLQRGEKEKKMEEGWKEEEKEGERILLLVARWRW
jgi:hypothetical protein